MIGLVVMATIIALVEAGLPMEPLVHWSMDLWNGSRILPDIGDAEKYSINLPASGYINSRMSGVIGDALYLSSKKVKLIEDVWSSDCIRNPVKCEDGLTISFWLKVQKLDNERDQVILRTTNPRRSRPGVYVGGIIGGNLLFLLRTAEGKRFEASIQGSTVFGKWSHFSMIWNGSLGIQISINGSQLSDSKYANPPTVENVTESYPSKVDFIAGDIPGPVFLLDDLWIFYRTLTSEDVENLYELGISEDFDPLGETTAPTTPGQDFTDTSALPSRATEVNKITEMEPASDAYTGTPTHFSMTTVVQDMAEHQRTNLVTIADKTPKSSTEPTVLVSNGFKKTTPRAKTTSTLYTGWFYMQPWYYTLLGVVLLALLAVSTWLCIVHCCLPATEAHKPSKTNGEESMSLEPLVQNT